MTADKKIVRTVKGHREYTYLGCPLTRNRSAWCFRLCIPDASGNGECGRLAPHGLKSKTQLAIEAHSKKLLTAHVEKLERLYLAGPDNEGYEPGVRISGGEAEVVIRVRDTILHAPDFLPASLCFKVMNDSAALAVNSLVENTRVLTVNFNVRLAQASASGDLIARSLFVGMSGDHYLAESVLIDSEGTEIGRGNGAFAESSRLLGDEDVERGMKGR
jgi:acyl-coenzyme A thioesterase PaaI-like protein